MKPMKSLPRSEMLILLMTFQIKGKSTVFIVMRMGSTPRPFMWNCLLLILHGSKGYNVSSNAHNPRKILFLCACIRHC